MDLTNTYLCRLCGDPAEYRGFCKCSPSLGSVHEWCLQQHLKETNQTSCSTCGTTFNVLKTVSRWRCPRLDQEDKCGVRVSVFGLLLLVWAIGLTLYAVLFTAEMYFAKNPTVSDVTYITWEKTNYRAHLNALGWTIVTLPFFCIFMAFIWYYILVDYWKIILHKCYLYNTTVKVAPLGLNVEIIKNV